MPISELPLETVINEFNVNGCFDHGAPYGAGHIHDTYRVVCRGNDGQSPYLLQKINDRVFARIPVMMDNIRKVTKMLRERVHSCHGDELSRRVLTLVPTRSGDCFWEDGSGGFWRVYHFIEDACSLEYARNCNQIEEAAGAYGRFLGALAHVPATLFRETIPHFHDGARRYAMLVAAIQQDLCGRAAEALHEIAFIENYRLMLDQPRILAARGCVPLRVTHNDTKLSNVLLDAHTGEGLCVIDLDTVMPGLALFDFGDMVRTMVSEVREDAPHPRRQHIDMRRFEALTRGFMAGAGDALNSAEIDSLVMGAVYMPLVIGTRFLTDFLTGDQYFKTSHRRHNLERCRVQFALAEQLSAQEGDLQDCIRRMR